MSVNRATECSRVLECFSDSLWLCGCHPTEGISAKSQTDVLYVTLRNIHHKYQQRHRPFTLICVSVRLSDYLEPSSIVSSGEGVYPLSGKVPGLIPKLLHCALGLKKSSGGACAQ